jgi:hypothetical protein
MRIVANHLALLWTRSARTVTRPSALVARFRGADYGRARATKAALRMGGRILKHHILIFGGLALVPGPLTGCVNLRYQNTAPFIRQGIRASHDDIEAVMFKASILVPARDILVLDPLRRALFGSEAWNLDDGEVPDSSFYTNRAPEELTPARVAQGACTMPPPRPPYQIKKLMVGGGGSLGFIGIDALGRTFLFKLDHPDYPELGSTAAIVGSRILWALGYNVPPVFLATIEGTGDERFDGERATAALFLDDVIGHFHFDWFRHRRELRSLRLASAWARGRVAPKSPGADTVTRGTCSRSLLPHRHRLSPPRWVGSPPTSSRYAGVHKPPITPSTT